MTILFNSGMDVALSVATAALIIALCNIRQAQSQSSTVAIPVKVRDDR